MGVQNASLQLPKLLSTTMGEPRPQPPSSREVSCGSHAAPHALVAETQVWTVDRKWLEPRWPPRTNSLVCEAERPKRNSHQMQPALTTLSLSTTEQGHTERPHREATQGGHRMCIPCTHQTSGSAIQNSSHHPGGHQHQGRSP